ncbi:chemotaxis protein CheA [Anopheles sinensis]|uniref:Chemotaxis protein CheA n=1 Tax=Anopheles sinensis TaxID=74873 RepID=A0A084VUT8_ANOSI|nr:chemotaxis protein CheA [Anopheles sinensis]
MLGCETLIKCKIYCSIFCHRTGIPYPGFKFIPNAPGLSAKTTNNDSDTFDAGKIVPNVTSGELIEVGQGQLRPDFRNEISPPMQNVTMLQPRSRRGFHTWLNCTDNFLVPPCCYSDASDDSITAADDDEDDELLAEPGHAELIQVFQAGQTGDSRAAFV